MATLLRATDLDVQPPAVLRWDSSHNTTVLTYSPDASVVAWGPRKPENTEHYPPAWVPAKTNLQLHSGTFRWDFVVEEMAKRQIGVGFMLAWDEGLDWGFFGYLGAGATAWAYDPSTGDVVNATISIQGGLPVFADGRRGVVTVELELPSEIEGRGRFLVNGTASSWISLPRGAVVTPAGCLLCESQRVRLGPLQR